MPEATKTPVEWTPAAKAATTFVLIAVFVLPLAAQVKLDPRIGVMRSVWLTVDDDLGAAHSVARCFGAAMTSAAMPLKLEEDKQLTQVIFRFRDVDPRVELSVELHDGQPLLAVTAPFGSGAAGVTRECVTAVILAEKLKVAIRSAREGIWFQEPSDPIIPEAGQSRAPAPPPAPPAAPLVETRFDVSGGGYQVIETNRVFWRFSWKMTIKNYGPDTIVVSPTVEFQNRNGLIVDTGIGEMKTIAAQNTVDITGTSLINADVAPSVANVYVRAKRIR